VEGEVVGVGLVVTVAAEVGSEVVGVVLVVEEAVGEEGVDVVEGEAE